MDMQAKDQCTSNKNKLSEWSGENEVCIGGLEEKIIAAVPKWRNLIQDMFTLYCRNQDPVSSVYHTGQCASKLKKKKKKVLATKSWPS